MRNKRTLGGRRRRVAMGTMGSVQETSRRRASQARSSPGRSVRHRGLGMCRASAWEGHVVGVGEGQGRGMGRRRGAELETERVMRTIRPNRRRDQCLYPAAASDTIEVGQERGWRCEAEDGDDRDGLRWSPSIWAPVEEEEEEEERPKWEEMEGRRFSISFPTDSTGWGYDEIIADGGRDRMAGHAEPEGSNSRNNVGSKLTKSRGSRAKYGSTVDASDW
ncbi:hypothetical protein C8R43DRAFT_959255 [Mycena crocata]|nr:hypothetical protein C8R43DRAFT_959255 [Mycena crocata]